MIFFVRNNLRISYFQKVVFYFEANLLGVEPFLGIKLGVNKNFEL